jgi:hypothetical protein
LLLAPPVSWKRTLIQHAGRFHRLHPEKTEVRIYDYFDRDVPMLARMFEKRLHGYRAIGYSTEIASRVVKILMQLPDGNISAAHLSVLYSRLIRQHAWLLS